MAQFIVVLSALIIGLAVGSVLGFLLFKNSYLQRKREAERSADQIIEDARREAQNIKRAAEIQAKDYWFKERRKFERETQEERKKLEQERKSLEEKEIQLSKKLESVQRKERELSTLERELKERERTLHAKETRLDELITQQTQKLEEVARLTREEARAELMKSIEAQAKYEAAQLIYKIREEARARAEREAKEIIADAIQRCAASHTAETAVTVVPLPSDEMKGRIIGREGRNIRAFEAVTGVEVIIDDTPEAVTISSFDPVKREIARLALERLIQDGRIHPARIEEVVARVKSEFNDYVRMIGEESVLELGIGGIHPELLLIIGKMKFRTSYGQNLLQHSKEVARLAAIMAGELNLSVDLAKRAGLLHDIGKTADQQEGPHALIGAQLAKRYGENEIVVNAIAAHHGDVEPKSVIAVIVAAADAISGARPGARRESLEAYIKRIEKLEDIAIGYPGVERAYAIQAGRELRVVVDAEHINDIQAFELAREIAKRIEDELEYPGQIKVTVIRETRAVEFAK
ncbi:MAG: ribonuclease Y [Candidatus Hydrothermota bacterium]|nr:MAG: ribonuclease Y [Candidatus Hydrothermae bacterium]